MKVFVTGAAGYIGSVVTEFLIEVGHGVVAYDNLQTGHREAVHEAAEFVEGDILDAPKLTEAMLQAKPDAVMHLAAESVVGESYQDPGKFFRVNVAGGVNVLEAMRAAEVSRIVFSSTASVYGEPPTDVVDEETPTIPVNPYGESKLQFERILDWYGRIYRYRHVSLRYFNASGATARNGEDRPAETHLIPILLDVVAGKRGAFRLFGTDYPTRDGTCVRDYVHVAAIARGHLLVLQRIESLRYRQYNLGSGKGRSNREVLAAVEAVTQRPVPVEEADRRLGDPATLVASAERIRQELGWEEESGGLEAIVRSAWEWRLAHPNGYGDSN